MQSNRDIIFVNPPYERIAPGYAFIKHITNRSPSLGLLHLAAEVRLHGYAPSIIESDILDMDSEAVARRVIDARPRFVGITLFTVGVWESVKIARKIKASLPETVIIVGGPHIASMGRETLERFCEFDVAVQGEGEKVLVELLKALEAGTPLAQVRGVIYRDPAGEVKSTVAPVTPNELDDLPFPAWDLLPDFPKSYPLAIYDYPKGPVATIAASRGCPFHCKFCDTSTFGARVRYYSPAKVVEMMRHLHETYGVRHVLFVDDLFLASRVRTTEFCNRLIESGLKMTWSCAARVDTVKPEILGLMKRAGCWQISFGLETGSDEMLRKMDKSARVERSEQAVRWTAAAGIRVKGLFMLGYPGETRESIQMTKDFVRRIPMTIMNLTKFTPYPGSPVYREIYGTTIREDHWEKMNGMNFVWSPPGLDVDELDRHYMDVIGKFYRQRSVRRQYVKLSVRYPGHFARLTRCGIGLLGAKARSLLSGRRGLLTQGTEVNLDTLAPAPVADAAPAKIDEGSSCSTASHSGAPALIQVGISRKSSPEAVA
ncbi:MAG: B12-binding domain-containing radical SAM protein [Tepidisphaeraceae bacterium]